MSLTIRPMTRADLERVYEIECVCFRTPWSLRALSGELHNRAAHYLVAEEEAQVMGYAGMWSLFDEAHITNIAVLPEYRRLGCGRRVMLAAMRLALEKGASMMTLEVREHNDAAIRMYHELGFLQDGFRPRYYDDTGEGALIMWNKDIRQTVMEKGTEQ